MLKRPAYLEIDLQQYRKNLRIIRRAIDRKVKIMSVVKDDAYGLGAVELSRIAIEEGITYFAVSNIIEAEELRESFPEIEILVLGYVPNEIMPIAIEKNIYLTIWDIEQANRLNQLAKDKNKVANVEIAVDTGLSRLGLLPDAKGLDTVIKISKLSHLKIKGIFSQFARTETQDNVFSIKQGNTFLDFTNRLKEKQIDIGHRHIADSAGMIKFKDYHLDMVRCGASALGSMTGKHVLSGSVDFNTRPIVSLKAKIARVEYYPDGTSISYDGSYETDHPIRVVTAPLGYGDGLSIDLQGKMEALVDGKRIKQVGEICMDMLMFSSNEVDCKEGDEIVFIGKQKSEEISLWDWSKLAQKSPTFLQSMLRDRIPKKYI